jgi:hypothetical protein
LHCLGICGRYTSPEIAAPVIMLLCTTGNFQRRREVYDLHVVFRLLRVFKIITKLCKQQIEVIGNHENANVAQIGAMRKGTKKM